MGLEIIAGVAIGVVAAIAFFIWIRKQNPPRSR
jgi:MFS superfamily sulfate permease-like transporter